MMRRHISLTFVWAVSAALQAAPSPAPTKALVIGKSVNIRSEPWLFSEVVTDLRRGEVVTVLGKVPKPHAKADEPTNWTKIRMPANTPVWVYAKLISTKFESKVDRLNIRAGPGLNYSVIGRLKKGEHVRLIRTLDDWMEIEAPPQCFGYVASQFLKPEPAHKSSVAPSKAPHAATKSRAPSPKPDQAHSSSRHAPPPPPVPKTRTGQTKTKKANTDTASRTKESHPAPPMPRKTRTQTVKSQPAKAEHSATNPRNSQARPAPAPPAPPTPRRVTASNHVHRAVISHPMNPTPSTEPATASSPSLNSPKTVVVPAPATPTPAPARIVRREGIVRITHSIQAPTYYELRAPHSTVVLDYLLPSSPELKLRAWKGKWVVVTGPELLDRRWPNTPILKIQRLELAP